MLLKLPPELIQLVLKHVDTPDYLEVAHSCRILYELASTCRAVLLHHLYRTPGLNHNVEELETTELYGLLVGRSRQQLYGAQLHASCKVLGLDNEVIDVQASSIAPPGHENLVALVFKGLPDVYVFKANGSGPTPFELRAQMKLPWGHFGAAEVLKTAPPVDNVDGILALYRFTAGMDENDPNSEHPFVREVQRYGTKGMVYMLHYYLDEETNQQHIRQCSFAENANYEPLAFAAADRDTFAISWRYKSDDHDHEVVMYKNFRDDELCESPPIRELDNESCVLVDAKTKVSNRIQNGMRSLDGGYLGQEQGPVKELVFNDMCTQILYHHGAQTLYGSFQALDPSCFPYEMNLQLYRNTCVVPFSNSLSLHFAIDIPFFGTHATITHNNMEMCNWKYLSLGIAKHRSEGWSVACLLRSEALCQSRNCEHELNLDRGRRFTAWTVVAMLSGFQESTSSIGSIAAASPLGTRIAVANWNAIYIWALEPNSIIEGNEDGYYPPCSLAENPDVVELRPVILPLDAVCFKMKFLDKENELLALTDRGLMYWDLGAMGNGEKEAVQLAI